MPQTVLSTVALAAIAFFLQPVSAGAQSLPGGATPGGAMPDLTEQRRPPRPAAPAVIIPPVLDRLEQDTDAGPRIPVQRFNLYANRNPATAWRGARYIPDVEDRLARALASQPDGGFTLGDIGELTEAIQSDLRERGMILAQVFIPVQQVTDGVVAIQVMEGRVGDVVAQGNERYGDEILKRPLTALTGNAVDNDSVERAVLLLRDYPGIAVAGVFSPGKELGTTDLTLRVQDEDRIGFNVTYDNHGSEFTGDQRAIATVNVNNLFDRADVLSLSLLQSFNPSNGTYGSLSYTIPFFAPDVYLNLGIVQNAFDIGAGTQVAGASLEGDTTVVQAGLSRAFVRSRARNLSGYVDLLSKSASVEDATTGRTQADDKLTVIDVGLRFDAVDTRFRGINTGFIGFSHGFPDVFGSLDEGDPGVELGSSRRNIAGTFAGGKFDKWYGQFSRLQQLGEHSELLLRTTAQASDDLIVSLEQFALGGPNSVRAYPPAEFLVDTGAFASVEWILAAPGFANASAFRGYNWGDVLRLSFFYDYAGGYLSEPAFGEQKTRDLHGYGAAIDFRLPGTFWTRLDVAKPQSGENPSDGDDPQFYFSFNFSF